MKKNSKRKKILQILLIIAVLAAVTASILYFMVFGNAFGYRQQHISEPNEVSPYLTHYIGPRFWEAVQRKKPFTLLLSQAGVNDIIARDSVVKNGWPATMDKVEIYAPFLKFSPAGVTVTDKIIYSGVAVYISLTAYPVFENGRMKLNIEKIMMGKINITSFAKATVEKMAKSYFDDKISLNPEQKIARSIIYGQWFDPVVRIGKSRLRITDITLGSEQIKVIFWPIKE